MAAAADWQLSSDFFVMYSCVQTNQPTNQTTTTTTTKRFSFNWVEGGSRAVGCLGEGEGGWVGGGGVCVCVGGGGGVRERGLHMARARRGVVYGGVSKLTGEERRKD